MEIGQQSVKLQGAHLEVSLLTVLENPVGADRAECLGRFVPVWRWLCNIYRRAGLPSVSCRRAFRPFAASNALADLEAYEWKAGLAVACVLPRTQALGRCNALQRCCAGMADRCSTDAPLFCAILAIRSAHCWLAGKPDGLPVPARNRELRGSQKLTPRSPGTT